MSLYLAESVLSQNLRERDSLEQAVDRIAQKAEAVQGSLVEVQVSNDLVRAFFVLEVSEQKQVKEIFAAAGVPVSLVKPVRLVGQQPEEIRKTADKARYLVEWNLPEGLTMEAYLARKKEKSPLYAEVPQVSFLRTYVCEDMTKCLCFYDAPDEETVHKAREVVQAPVDTITETTAITQRTVK